MKKKINIMKIMMAIMTLVVCMCVPVNAAKLKSGGYTYSTKTRGDLGKEKTTIYRQKNGGTKKKLITVSGRVDKIHYVYNNKLFYSRSYGDGAPAPFKTEYINLRNNKRTVLADDLDIVGHSGCYAVVMPSNDSSVQPLYIMNVNTRGKRWIASNVLYEGACIAKNGRIYYLKCDKMTYGAGKNKYTVYSCRKDGSGKRKIKTIYSKYTGVRKMTDKYIILNAYGTYYYDGSKAAKGTTYRY